MAKTLTGPRSFPVRRVVRHPGRVAIVVIVIVACVNLGVLLLTTADTTAPGAASLPEGIESVSPDRDSLASPRATISADLRDDLYGVLVLDRTEIPEDQLDRVEGLGLVSFRPGPDRDLSALASGEHQVVVYYWPRGEPRPAKPSSFAWTFRTAA